MLLLALSEPIASDPARALLVEAIASLGLLVLAGLVWGEEAGDDTRGGCRGC